MQIKNWTAVWLLLWGAGCAQLTADSNFNRQGLIPLVHKIQKAVVTVVTYDIDGKVSGLGSGFFIDARGHMITNFHVLKGAYAAEVKTYDGQKLNVELVVAENESMDLVKVRVVIPESGVQWVRISDTVPEIAERIVVVGSPLGLEQTVSEGIVSAVRDLPQIGQIFQMSAPISPGSSGSPVVDMRGNVIGVVTFQSVMGQNLNFAMSGKGVLDLVDAEIAKTLPEWTYAANEKVPKLAEELCRKGFNFSIQGEYVKALEFYRQAAEDNPTDAVVWYGLGHCYIGLDQPEEAIDAYKQAVRTNPADPSARYTLGNYYAQLGRYEEAITIYKEALGIDPAYVPAYFDLGITYGRLERLDEERQAFEEVIRLKPDHAPSYYNVGLAYAKLGRLEEAIGAHRQVIRLKPDHAPSYYHIGILFGRLGKTKASMAAYKAAVRIDPDFPPAHYSMGVAYFHAGEKDLALGEYKILRHLDTDMAQELFDLIYQ